MIWRRTTARDHQLLVAAVRRQVDVAQVVVAVDEVGVAAVVAVVGERYLGK